MEHMEFQYRVLITGSNSYVGGSLEQWLSRYEDRYLIDTVSTFDNAWEKIDFGVYDTVVHVGAIVHRQETPGMERLYREVNRDLAIRIATRARDQGVRQFILMSTMSVYGKLQGVIDNSTPLLPGTLYGTSKLEAERGILPLQSDRFDVVVLRPPMIYGKGAKGNYLRLSRLARECPVFPEFDNSRSMLYIDNLCEFVRLMIENREKGVFHPQNKEYVNTSDMVKYIAEVHGRRIRMTTALNPVIRLLISRNNTFSKVFGTLVYDKGMSEYKSDYWYVADLRRSIELTEA